VVKIQKIETMVTYRLVTIGEEVSLTLRWAESENSQEAIKELIKWARANNFVIAQLGVDKMAKLSRVE
jgi:ABC-type uncharacterized transport system substrate-binding protein